MNRRDHIGESISEGRTQMTNDIKSYLNEW